VLAIPSVDGSTVQVKVVLAVAPVLSVAVTVTVELPAVVGVPLIVPELEMAVPAGRPVAVKVGVCPLVESVAFTATETAVPASSSCGPGLVTVTGWPSWDDETARVFSRHDSSGL
jgi:hypothetical protein